MPKGIDISHHNSDRLGERGITTGRFLLARAAGYRFCIVKATEGTTYKDPRFTENWTRAQQAGMRVGAYHFARPSVGDAADEARFFAATVRTVGGWDPGNVLPVLDLETTGDLGPVKLSIWAGNFVDAIKTLTGRRTLVYTYTSFLPNLVGFDPHNNPLWIARYTTAATPGPVRPWQEWDCWQYTSSGRVPGMPGNTDVNTAPVLDAILAQPPPRPNARKYAKVTFRGKRVDAYTRACLQAVERKLGYELVLTQGSYNNTVGASAGTHAGGGVVDIRAGSDPGRKVRRLRETGMIAWHRTPAEGPWPSHIHAVQRGNARLSPAAQRQVAAWKAGKNGLADGGPDTGPDINVPVFPWPSPN